MRFGDRDRPGSPTPYWNRAFQMRMIALCIAAGLVIAAIKITSNPKFWARWFPEEPAAGTAGSDQPASPARTLKPDEVLVAARDEVPVRAPVPDAATGEDAGVESSLPEIPPRPETESVEFDRDRLLVVQDDTVRMRREELEPFYYLLDHAVRVPLDELHAAAMDDVAREALLAQPGRYRGEPITITGTLRRNLPITAVDNVYGVSRYFEAWVIVPNSSNIPWRVVALEMDASLPLAESIAEAVPVRMTGYFFKIEGYQAASGLQVAPVLIARKLEPAPPAERFSVESGDKVHRGVFFAFVGIFAVAICAVWIAMRGDRRNRSRRRETLESGGDLQAIQGAQSFDPAAHLRDLARPGGTPDERD